MLDAASAAETEQAPPPPVDEATVLARLRADFEASQGRPMTPAEERHALADHQYEQELFGAALAMGMHETDPIVRRRLVQRMRFLVENMVHVPEPTEDDLVELMEQRPDQFPRVRTFSFEHRFFARSVHGAGVRAAASRARQALARGAEVSGDPFPRRLRTEEVSVAELARAVGPTAAEAFFDAERHSWSEPIPSAYGAHLVRVTARTSRPLELPEVRPRVEALWEHRTRQERGRELMGSIASEG